jgi:fumarate reductase flavoprotein subunit
MAQDTLVGGKNLGDPALVDILAQNSAGSVEWLTSLGADLSNVGSLAGSSVPRAHRPTGGVAVGKHMIAVLRTNAADRKIDVRLNSKAVRILEDGQGGIEGVRVYGKHRRSYTIRAHAVVIAAGGFSANPARVAYYQPSYAGMTTSNQPGATGDGLDLGVAVNGQLIDMAFIQIHPTLAAGTKTLITEGVRGNGAIMVNREGLRFVNEMATRDVASAAVLAQTGKTAFLVFDEAIRASLAQIEGYFRLGVVKEGDTVDALAAQIAAPPAELAATIASYNQAFVNQVDPQWNRKPIPRPISTPNYYAIEVAPGVHYTMGGLKIDTDSRVISLDGTPIAGLFAAGEVTGGIHGANRLGGNSTSETVTFGRIAGVNAAKLARQAGGCAR